MRPLLGPDEEGRIGLQAALLVGVQLDEPAPDAIWIELRVPRRVQRVGQIYAAAVAAELDHLGSAVQRPGAVHAGPSHDSTQPDRAGLARPGGVTHVVALQLACSPAGRVE